MARKLTQAEKEWAQGLRIGSKVDALDFVAMWYTASIIDTDPENDEVLIHYDNWDPKWDEWLSRFSPRLAMHETKANGGRYSGGVAEQTVRN